MSFHTSQPLPPEDSNITAARRRKKRRALHIEGEEQKAEFLEEFAHQSLPQVEFYIFSLLAGLLLAAAMYSGKTVLFLLAVVTVPFISPLAGLSLATIIGSTRFFVLNLGGLLLGSLLMFSGGLLGGWIFAFLGKAVPLAAFCPELFSLLDTVVLTLGAALTTFSMARSPRHKPALIGALLTYEIFIPLGIAGFALSAAVPGMAVNGLAIYVAHLAWAVLAGALVLAINGLRPSGLFTYAGAAVMVFLCILMFSQRNSNDNSSSHNTPTGTMQQAASIISVTPPAKSNTPLPTATITATATKKPTSTITPTLTLTATPTAVYALVAAKEGHGAIIRAEPDADSAMVATPLNDTLVEIYEELLIDNISWVHVRLIQDGNEIEGWIMRGLITTATPRYTGAVDE